MRLNQYINIMSQQKPLAGQIATEKVHKVRSERSFNTDNDLAKAIGISKVTLYARLKSNAWTCNEILAIEYITNKKFKNFVNHLNLF